MEERFASIRPGKISSRICRCTLLRRLDVILLFCYNIQTSGDNPTGLYGSDSFIYCDVFAGGPCFRTSEIGVTMSLTTIDRLNAILADISSRVECIRGIVLSSADGLKIADRFRDHAYDTQIAHAISASIVGLANRSVHNLGLPLFDHATIYTGEGIVVVFNLNDASLLALLDPDANVGLAMIELQHVAEQVKKVMRL